MFLLVSPRMFKLLFRHHKRNQEISSVESSKKSHRFQAKRKSHQPCLLCKTQIKPLNIFRPHYFHPPSPKSLPILSQISSTNIYRKSRATPHLKAPLSTSPTWRTPKTESNPWRLWSNSKPQSNRRLNLRILKPNQIKTRPRSNRARLPPSWRSRNPSSLPKLSIWSRASPRTRPINRNQSMPSRLYPRKIQIKTYPSLTSITSPRKARGTPRSTLSRPSGRRSSARAPLRSGSAKRSWWSSSRTLLFRVAIFKKRTN